jgi:hypothetical protein
MAFPYIFISQTPLMNEVQDITVIRNSRLDTMALVSYKTQASLIEWEILK